MAACTAGVISAAGTPRKATLSVLRAVAVDPAEAAEAAPRRLTPLTGGLPAPVTFMDIPEKLTAFDANAVKGI
jgi:hypothetical protein